ncbi:MAG: DUF1836 domain-containing protein [Oscillospiraceae bacterium]|nr:DUF1836 domain-containing protein [Oscillospiraceae bacterium]
MQDIWIPGTTIPFSDGESVFQMFRPLIRATDGLTLGQVCKLTGLEQSTVQNWIKRGFVPHPIGKKYHERQLARILLISALRDSLQIDRIGALMQLVNGDADDESDDIISEPQLYDDLCACIARTKDRTPGADGLSALIRDVTAERCATDPEAARRLREALAVMVCAYIAAQYKQEAERRFRALAQEQEDHNG